MKDRKEEILLATLELAGESGLGNVSMSQIASKVGIRKPSLYNHFQSKEEIIEELYKYLREEAKKNTTNGQTDYGKLVVGHTALEVLQMVVANYTKMNSNEKILLFYKFIYSERSLQPMAAKIMVEETEKMILATKQLFYAMQIHGLLEFRNADMSAVSFAMTIHSLMDYQGDLERAEEEKSIGDSESGKELMNKYLEWFSKENEIH